MARPRKYTPARLYGAVRGYFDSISREAPVMETVETGERDKYGHPICRQVVAKNRLGETVTATEYLIAPTVGNLALALEIHRSTWDAYCNDPAYDEATQYARDRMRAYLEQQLLIRKDVKGVIFDLENNYGYRERQHVEVGGSVEEYLRTLDEAGQKQEF